MTPNEKARFSQRIVQVLGEQLPASDLGPMLARIQPLLDELPAIDGIEIAGRAEEFDVEAFAAKLAAAEKRIDALSAQLQGAEGAASRFEAALTAAQARIAELESAAVATAVSAADSTPDTAPVAHEDTAAGT